MAEESAEVVAQPEKKSNLLLIIVVALITSFAGAGGVYFMMGKQAGKAATAEEEKAPEKAPAVYVEFDPPFVANFEAKGVVRFLQITIQVMTRSPEVAELIKKHDPRIRNDLLLMFSNQTYETVSTREGKERLRAEALKVVSEVIDSEEGKGKEIEQLYFTSFVMQ